ncbi:hypothetical protein NW752_008290 [Fusarium irregulare]|uniref:Uncharacterized protein n=1 Tax=Fusarium irregulare TaxID=2494466 RepID=A0A9W8PVI0_9HYPO|nr:hypothetical protein NW752_008290 [Fusarium irregulare]KAJ4019462.1 hypothetical protein NW766_003189 [Fusarium irregulare]
MSLALSGYGAWASPCKPSRSVIASSEASSFIVETYTTDNEWSSATTPTTDEEKTDGTLLTGLLSNTIDLPPPSLSEYSFTPTYVLSTELSPTLTIDSTSQTTSRFDGSTTSILTQTPGTNSASLSQDPIIVSTDSSMADFDTLTTTGSDIPLPSDMSSISTQITEPTEASVPVSVSTTTDLTSSYTEYPTSHTTAMHTTDSAALSITTSVSSDVTSSLPATTSSAVPFMFKIIARDGFRDGSEMRAFNAGARWWGTGRWLLLVPTILTVETSTSHLIAGGVPVCAEFSRAGTQAALQAVLRGCATPMLHNHEHVMCEPAIDGGELRCSVPELNCVSDICARTGQLWTQFYSRNWLEGTRAVSLVPAVNSLDPIYTIKYMIQEVQSEKTVV